MENILNETRSLVNYFYSTNPIILLFFFVCVYFLIIAKVRQVLTMIRITVKSFLRINEFDYDLIVTYITGMVAAYLAFTSSFEFTEKQLSIVSYFGFTSELSRKILIVVLYFFSKFFYWLWLSVLTEVAWKTSITEDAKDTFKWVLFILWFGLFWVGFDYNFGNLGNTIFWKNFGL